MQPHVQQQLNDIVQQVIRAVPTREIFLFGSYASGTERTDSDLDIYVLTDGSLQRPMDDLRSINRSLRSVRRMPVDILVLPHADFYSRARLTPTLEHKVLKEGQRIYVQ